MSTLTYAALTSKRKQAEPRDSTAATQPPGITTFLDGLAALVPGEVLALHAFVLAGTTESIETPDGQIAVTIPKENLLSLRVWFVVLVVLSIGIYIIGRFVISRNNCGPCVRSLDGGTNTDGVRRGTSWDEYRGGYA